MDGTHYHRRLVAENQHGSIDLFCTSTIAGRYFVAWLDLSAENATNISCGLLCFHQICQKPTWNLHWQNGINLSHSQQSTSKPMMDCESRMCFCHENSYGEPFYPGNLQCHIFLCLSILSDFLALATNAGETLLSHHPLATNPLSSFPSAILLRAKTVPASYTTIK